jgi:hypothetical protein
MRPDQPRFDQFSVHLEAIDDVFDEFCRQRNLTCVRNPLRQPERDIRQEGNPTLIMGVWLSGYWLTMDYSTDMPHDFSIVATLKLPSGENLFKEARLVKHQPFSYIVSRLEELMEQGWNELERWKQELTSLNYNLAKSLGWNERSEIQEEE